MRVFGKFVLAGVLLGGASSPLFAQATASQNATATTRIIQPISLAKNSDLAFGSVVRPSTGTNAILINNATGARTQTGTGNAVLATSTSGRAAFTVTGEGAQTFSITVPATVSMISGANNIAVTLSATGTTGTLSGALGATGTATFGVGGSFNVTTTQASGNYSGTFAVTVAYN